MSTAALWAVRTSISAAHRCSKLWLINNLRPHSRPCSINVAHRHSSLRHTHHPTFFFLQARATSEIAVARLQGPLEIDKHLELYKLKTKQKTKSSQLASQVMEQSSRFLLTAQSADGKRQALQSSYSVKHHTNYTCV